MPKDEVKEIHKWTDEATGYECLAVELPWFCGYVRLPEGHPWIGKWRFCDHDGCYEHTIEGMVEVHGGITFGPGRPHGATGGSWIGFDCAHAGDYVDYKIPSLASPGDHRWTLDEVKAECASLAKQIHDHG